MPSALGIDAGTTNLKVALVRDDGTIAGAAQRAVPITRGPGTAEQDADELWDRLAEATRELTSACPDDARDIVAVGVCSQYSSVVPVDAAAQPVGPMLMWQDQRGTDHSFEIMAREESSFMTFVEHHGIPPIGSGLSLGHILHVQLDDPDRHARTAAYLEAMDYLTARFTGRITASQHSTFMYQLCDNRTLGATAYDDELVKLSGVDPTRLPPLIAIDAAVGPLRADVADTLGLPTGALVYAGTNDSATGAVATGVFSAGRAGLAIGTTSVLLDGVDEFRVDLEHQLISMPGPYPDRYLLSAENGLGGKVLEHVLRELLLTNDELGEHDAPEAFARLDRVLDVTEPGARGVLFLPWLNGSLAPTGNTNQRGGFVNMSLDTRRRDLVRAVVEGVAHNLRWLLPHVEAFTGAPVDEIAFIGGAARSRAWTRILADVLDRPVLPLDAPEHAVARAAGLLALERHGITPPTVPAASAARAEPNPEVRVLYDTRQAQFEAAYAALLPISEALQ